MSMDYEDGRPYIPFVDEDTAVVLRKTSTAILARRVALDDAGAEAVVGFVQPGETAKDPRLAAATVYLALRALNEVAEAQGLQVSTNFIVPVRGA